LHQFLEIIRSSRQIDLIFEAQSSDKDLIWILSRLKFSNCPICSLPAPYGRRRQLFYCNDCELAFESTSAPDTPRLTEPKNLNQEESSGLKGRVFLSYGHDPGSTELVSRIEHDLRHLGWIPWMDRSEISFGDDWRFKITKGIHESQHVLAFLSEHSTRKPGVCRQEIAIALGPRKGHVYTILVEPPSQVKPPLIISHLQWLDMHEWRDLREKKPEAAETLYQESLKKIVLVLERNQPFSGDIEDLRCWLKPWDSTSDLISAEQGFTGRRWLLDGLVDPPLGSTDLGSGQSIGEIESWRRDLNGPSVFWISAGPGWGKSAIAARLAHSARSRVMAIHVCRHDQPFTRDARIVIRSIAFQMATQLGDYREQLMKLVRDKVSLEGMNASELFAMIFSNPLAYGVGGHDDAEGKRLVVIDALDESIEAGKSELLNLISSDFRRIPNWIGLVVTSRPEAPVMRQLASFGIKHQQENDPRNQEDLADYIRAWLETLSLTFEQRSTALNCVVRSCDGMFLYLRKLQEAVATGLISVDQLLDPSDLPKGLGELYERWFWDRFKDKHEYTSKQQPFLELALAASESLELELIADVLGWSAYDEHKVLESLGSLCRLEGKAVSLFHKSLSDWLRDPLASGIFYANHLTGHERLALHVETTLCRDPKIKEIWPNYLLRFGAAHAAFWQRPDLGARFLTTQLCSEASNRLLPGPLRTAIDSYLNALVYCNERALNSIPSIDIAELVSRTDTRNVLGPACDLLIDRESDWESAFASNPLDSRGATWVFASRWSSATLDLNRDLAQRRLISIRDVAITPTHPLNLPAAYAFKYVAHNRPEWVSIEMLEPFCKSWTYSRLVSVSLLQQLTLNGSTIATSIPWADFWTPPWQYCRNEIDLLAAALTWKGLSSPVQPRGQTILLMDWLADKQKTLLARKSLSKVHREALEFFWKAGGDPEKCQNLLKSLDVSGTSNEILNMYLRSPIFDAVEVAAAIVANRVNEFAGDLAGLLKLADPDTDCAWGAFMAASKTAIASNATEEFLQLVTIYGTASDPWCRGLSANYFAKWLRDASENVRSQVIMDQKILLKQLLHDHDIWPVQEIFHAMQEFSDSLELYGIDWQKELSAETAPIIAMVDNWRDADCGWAKFESAATAAVMRNPSCNALVKN
jgi:hypothetical protein